MDINKYSPLRWKIVASTLLFSLVPLISVSLFIHLGFIGTYKSKVHSTLHASLENKKVAIDLFLGEKIDQVKLLAYSHSIKELSDQQRLGALFETIKGNSKSFIDIGVIGSDGKHITYAGPYDLMQANYKDEGWFHEVLLRGVYISDVFMGFRNYPHVIIAVARREENATWILRLTLDLEYFNQLVQSVQMGRQGDAYLINREGRLQTASRFLGAPHTVVADIKASPFLGDQIDEITVGGHSRIVGKTWLNTVKWMLVISEDPDEELSVLIRDKAYNYGVIILGILIIVAGTLITTDLIIRKIKEADLESARLDAELMQQSKMAALGKMAAGVAHEINNPLTLIRESAGWIRDLMLEEAPERMENYDEILETLGKIDLHVERAKGVTHRMLGFGRRMDPRQENVNLNQLMDETLKFLENEALHHNITIERHYDPTLPNCSTDPNQVQQVMLNLVDNAIDAVGDEGAITIRSGFNPDSRELFVQVSDSGPGISKELMAKIFDPFFTTKKPGEGTGLGLSIVPAILDKLGGRIQAESEEGHGAAFTMYLPCDPGTKA